jgi:MFS-type transporter involved in bile tolerance (Atg22 family)
MTIYKARKLYIGAGMLTAIELMGDLVAVIGTILFSRVYKKTSYQRIFFFGLVSFYP